MYSFYAATSKLWFERKTDFAKVMHDIAEGTYTKGILDSVNTNLSLILFIELGLSQSKY